jgi:MFS family permease
MCAVYIAMLLVSLVRPNISVFQVPFLTIAQDRIIISTAIPKITDQFNSIKDIGWYGSSYVLASCVVQLPFGRLYSYYNTKTIFLSSVLVFEAGSALCGAAPNSHSFIVGRALAGAASAGVMSGVIVIMIPLVPLEKRPILQGLLGAIFGVSSVIGPLIGGAFTNNVHLTWRWCFYINLPIGAVSILIIIFFLHPPARPKSDAKLVDKVKRMDPVGNILFAPAIISLLLALQWGGVDYSWHDARIIALLVLFSVLIVGWIASQALNQQNGTVPPRILFQRSIIAGFTFSTCIGGVMLCFAYYMSIWFQAVEGVDALTSGIRTLPFILALVAASIVTGGLVSRIGYYTPFVIICACFMAVGAGLLTTLQITSSRSQWVGYQFLLGFGMGLGMQQTGMAAQVVLKPDDVPVGVSLGFVGQSLGGAIFVCAAQNVFLSSLVKDLSAVLPVALADRLSGIGATDFRQLVPANFLTQVLVAYNKAITTTFYVGLAAACFSIVPACLFEWKTVKGIKGKRGTADT